MVKPQVARLPRVFGKSRAIDNLARDLSTMAECEFAFEPRTETRGVLGVLGNKLSTMLSNLNETLRQMIEFTEMISATSADISGRNEELARRTQEQASSLEETSATMEELSATVQENAQHADQACAIARRSSELACDGRASVSEMSETMDAIASSSARIGGIVEVINTIAFQTNILALNAAVEAARAGEQGRGFGVVAGEVRGLAGRCAAAAKEISSLIADSSGIVDRGQILASNAEERMQMIVEGAQQASVVMEQISQATNEQSKGIRQANDAIARMDQITQQNSQFVAGLAERAAVLEDQSRFLTDAVNVFKLKDPRESSHPVHDLTRRLAETAAGQVAAAFEQALATGRLGEEDLFDTNYEAVPETDPPKYRTRFDALTDELLPAIQEPILERHPHVVFAAAVDSNGYLPTHNARFCKPLTGDREVDLTGNRTKRIFSDRVGIMCGRHTDPFKIQSYRRDTGELVFDMSVPIHVVGRHWGGFRIGYRIQ